MSDLLVTVIKKITDKINDDMEGFEFESPQESFEEIEWTEKEEPVANVAWEFLRVALDHADFVRDNARGEIGKLNRRLKHVEKKLENGHVHEVGGVNTLKANYF